METDKNALIAEWRDKWALFRSRSIPEAPVINTRKYPGTRRTRPSWYHFRTQNIRRDIARNLGELYDLAVEISKREDLELEKKERWIRLSAYLAQSINTVTRTYDKVKIEESIKSLEKYVRENIEA